MTVEVKEYYPKREVSCNSCFSVLLYSHEDVKYAPGRSEGFLTVRGYPYLQCPVCHQEVIVKE